ncbi:hypothetical protein L7F22_056035 [Adiantum nelumboides]|nr:hypothetical protein [Adiantum nelumboides]
MAVSKHSFALSEYNEAFKKLELLQADVDQNEEADPFIEVKFIGGNKCGDQDSKVLGHAEKEDVLDKEAEPNAEVEIVRGYNCEEQDPSMEVHVEKEGMLEKDSPEYGDQAKKLSINEGQQRSVSQRHQSFHLADHTNDAKGKKEKDDSLSPFLALFLKLITVLWLCKVLHFLYAATSNIDNLDHIISMIAKSTMKDPLDVDTSFRVEGQVPCASNIEDQEDKNTRVFCPNTGEDTEIIIKKSEPPQETGDASVEAGGDASCAGEDMEIISEKSEPPLENGDALVNLSVDASGDAICVGGTVGAGVAGEDTAKQPQENGDASVDASVDASCGGDAVGVGGASEDTIEPPQENGDASVDASGDASCGGGAIGAGGAVGASATKYVRHNHGTVSHPWEDGGDARGVAGYVRNDDGMVSRPWEDPRNILFESKPAIILDINGVLLTSVDKRYCSQMPA